MPDEKRPSYSSLAVVTQVPTENGSRDTPVPILNNEAQSDLLTTIAIRVERIDRELDLVGEAVRLQSTLTKAVRHDIAQLCSDVKELNRKSELTLMMLQELLTRD